MENPNPIAARIKAKQAGKPTIITKTILVPASHKPSAIPKAAHLPSKPSPSTSLKAKPKAVIRHAPRPTQKPKASRPTSRESADPVKNIIRKHKSASPATPRFTDSDDESDEEDEEKARKRRRKNQSILDPTRSICDAKAFSESDQDALNMIHSADIANLDIIEHNRNKYTEFFTAFAGDSDEEVAPIITLQYPSAYPPERYQLARPNDLSDFKPLDEIMWNMKIVSEHYLNYTDSKKIFDEDEPFKCLVGRLQRAAKHGSRNVIGAQQEFIDVVDEFNALLIKLRKDGTMVKAIEEMKSIPFSLVEHIVKTQVYARIVSPSIGSLKKYEGFSNNTYGELLPPLLSEIFKQTRLKSNQVFVDLGSGVGNCVLQAALETGCESWGCEMVDSYSDLADKQATEFSARCRLWGLSVGEVHLMKDDFLKCPEIDAALIRADVVLINNQVFSPTLNEALKMKFLDLKEGCHVVSLKPFVDPDHQIKATNIQDTMNVWEVEKKPRYSNHVSWAAEQGNWYIHRKDSGRVKKFLDSRRSRNETGSTSVA